MSNRPHRNFLHKEWNLSRSVYAILKIDILKFCLYCNKQFVFNTIVVLYYQRCDVVQHFRINLGWSNKMNEMYNIIYCVWISSINIPDPICIHIFTTRWFCTVKYRFRVQALIYPVLDYQIHSARVWFWTTHPVTATNK